MSTPKNEAWDAFMGTLPAQTRERFEKGSNPTLPVDTVATDLDEEEESYDKFINFLPKATREALIRKNSAPPEAAVETATARWGIIECPSGEWAQMRLFKSAESLARRITQLEGSDTIVWCFFGLPMSLTKGPQRYLQLPGGTQMIQVPIFEGGPCKIVDADLLGSIEIEESGFIGPKELAEAVMPEDDPEAKAATSGDDDDDDD